MTSKYTKLLIEFCKTSTSNLLDAYYRKIEYEQAKKQANERSIKTMQVFYRILPVTSDCYKWFTEASQKPIYVEK